ncbi:unnamed protein product [Clavelina lepadiformis]|uniref:DOMON domain-containing protein n=1 Tax=Clavelina lepadiformis TaxID=159417 RepID=A0ABP0GUX3_CLALP
MEDKACATENGVIKMPPDCDEGFDFTCDAFVSWSLKNDVITFTEYLHLGSTTSRWLHCAWYKAISDNKVMPSLDIYFGWMRFLQFSTEVIFWDSWARVRAKPETDNQQNFSLISSTTFNGVLSLTFSRPRDTGDGADWSFSDTECRHLLFAAGPVFNKDISYHTQRMMLTDSKVCIRPCSTNNQERDLGLSLPRPQVYPLRLQLNTQIPRRPLDKLIDWVTFDKPFHVTLTIKLLLIKPVDIATTPIMMMSKRRSIFLRGSFRITNLEMNMSYSDQLSQRFRQLRSRLQKQIMDTLSHVRSNPRHTLDMASVKVIALRRRIPEGMSVAFNGNGDTRAMPNKILQGEIMSSFKEVIRKNLGFLRGHDPTE